jgi:hypothetical protein
MQQTLRLASARVSTLAAAYACSALQNGSRTRRCVRRTDEREWRAQSQFRLGRTTLFLRPSYVRVRSRHHTCGPLRVQHMPRAISPVNTAIHWWERRGL